MDSSSLVELAAIACDDIKAANIKLLIPEVKESGPGGIIPTSSIITQASLGSSLIIAVMKYKKHGIMSFKKWQNINRELKDYEENPDDPYYKAIRTSCILIIGYDFDEETNKYGKIICISNLELGGGEYDVDDVFIPTYDPNFTIPQATQEWFDGGMKEDVDVRALYGFAEGGRVGFQDGT